MSRTRISAVETDPAFDMEYAAQCRIFLDGIEVEPCTVFTADSEKGEILRIVTDENGKKVIRPDGNSRETEIVYGRVEIRRTNHDE